MKIRSWLWTIVLASVITLIALTDTFSLHAVEAGADIKNKFQRTGWNSHVKQRYMHPPVFHFTPLENGIIYRYRLWEQSDVNNIYHVESGKSDVDLAAIWERLPRMGYFQVIAERVS